MAYSPIWSPSASAPRRSAPTHLAATVLEKARAATSVVRLIDRRTGLTHRVNGTPLMVFTHSPDETVAELLSGRDRTVWEARVDLIQPSA